jgi:diadenosine tetraphosphatase ApaH/serine/threonine PP2A family protein phosphatase
MRYAILSDIHGNYEALQAVLDDIDMICESDGVPCEAKWCLGDIVGYGPDPSACVRTIRQECELTVAGNHDWGASGIADLNEFSDMARDSLLWTSKQLQQDELEFLITRPDRTTVPIPEDCTLVHGSPVVPIWEYLLTPEAAALSFLSFPTRFCVVGHTHLPTIFLQESARYNKPRLPVLAARERQVMEYGSEEEGIIASTLELDALNAMPPCIAVRDIPVNWWWPPDNFRAIINPGSIGQPRDGDPRAAYMLYDTELGFAFRRIPYWIERTIEKLRDEDAFSQFAESLVTRLIQGY